MNYRLTALAKGDLSAIRSYTKRRHGDRQCALYLGELRASFRLLAEHPALGSAADDVRPGLRHHRQGRHVVFYVPKPYGVRIVRVLHERMDASRQEFSDEEP